VVVVKAMAMNHEDGGGEGNRNGGVKLAMVVNAMAATAEALKAKALKAKAVKAKVLKAKAVKAEAEVKVKRWRRRPK
jgi:mannose/fructose-specific phosphotransferase system component IIA